MTLPHQGHIVKTTYFGVRIFLSGGTYLSTLFDELPRRGLLGKRFRHWLFLENSGVRGRGLVLGPFPLPSFILIGLVSPPARSSGIQCCNRLCCPSLGCLGCQSLGSH
jgi:hypothetical protein